MGGAAIKSLTDSEIGDMLSSIAWRKVRSMLMKELEERPKLGMMKESVALEFKLSCEEEERQEKEDQTKRGHSSIPDRGGKEVRSGEEGKSM